MGANHRRNSAELHGWNHLHFVENEQTPIDSLNLVHSSLNFFATASLKAYHKVGTDNHSSLVFVKQLVAVFGGESTDRRARHVCPLVELLSPLLHRNVWIAKHEYTLFDVRRCCDSSQSFARTAGENNNAGASAPIREHLTQRSLLVISYDCGRLKLNFKIWRLVVPFEVILLY